MKKPKEPLKPKTPIKPNKYLRATKNHISIYDGSSLADIIRAVGEDGVDPTDALFTSVQGYYDDYEYRFEWNAKSKLNLQYENQLLEYQEKMTKYNQNIEMYYTEKTNFLESKKQYLKWFYEKELKKLDQTNLILDFRI